MRTSFLTASCAAIAALLVASGYAQVNCAGARGFTAAALTAPPTAGWPTNGGNLYNQRYSPLKSINRDNVTHSDSPRLKISNPSSFRVEPMMPSTVSVTKV